MPDKGEEEVERDRTAWGAKRARRPDDDKVSYVLSASKSLDQLLVAGGAAQADVQVLVANTLSEVDHAEASLASHRRASRALESLLSHASAEAASLVPDKPQAVLWHLVLQRVC